MSEGDELGISVASLGVKQLENVSPLNLSETMRNWTLTEAIWREQIGGMCDSCFQERRK